jgi:hypothetical protein
MENTTKALSKRFAFIKALFDFKFEEFIYIKVARFLYLISVIVIGLATIAMMLISLWGIIQGLFLNDYSSYGFEYYGYFMSSLGWPLVGLFFASPVVGLLSIILLRLGFESGIALVAIAENTKKKIDTFLG